jgi:DNA-binding transcriptional MocR family regulator
MRVPASLIEDSTLNAKDREVYLALVYFAGPGGTCFPSYSTLCKLCKSSRNTISKALKRLEERDYIRVDSGWAFGHSKRTNTYYLTSIIYKKKVVRNNPQPQVQTAPKVKYVPKIPQS